MSHTTYNLLLLPKLNNMITTYYSHFISNNQGIGQQTYSKHLEGKHLDVVSICLAENT